MTSNPDSSTIVPRYLLTTLWSLALFQLFLFSTSSQALAENPVSFSIAIHGGAGGDPSKWNDAQKQARLDGLDSALQHGVERLKRGDSALDVCEAVVRMLEDNPVFNAGRGAVLNAEGEHELDASIMDGKTLGCGAVAGIRTIKNPISLARRVMTDTQHVLLLGKGADEFGQSLGLETAPAEYFRTEEQKASWQKWKDRQQPQKGDMSHATDVEDPLFYLGTVGCVVRDQAGNLAAATSTGGLLAKRYGRIGDSPIIGAGTIADNRTCAISCTGIGEQFIRHAVASDISARMRYAHQSLDTAIKEVIEKTLPQDCGGIIGVDAQGNISMQFNTPGMSRASADSNGTKIIALGK